jgi:hypothetical protein
VDGGAWFGFDTCHNGDRIPGIIDGKARTMFMDMLNMVMPRTGRIWTEDDVQEETEKLAKQLAEMKTTKKIN